MVCDLFQEWYHGYKDNLIRCQIMAQTLFFDKISVFLLFWGETLGDIGFLTTFASEII